MATNKVTVIMANEKDGVVASRKQFFCKLAIFVILVTLGLTGLCTVWPLG